MHHYHQRGRRPHGIGRFGGAGGGSGRAAARDAGCDGTAQANKKTDAGRPAGERHPGRAHRAAPRGGSRRHARRARPGGVSAEVDGRVARLAADMGDRVSGRRAAGRPRRREARYRADEQQATLEQTRARLGAHGEELPAPGQTPDVLSAAAQHTEAEQQLERARRLAGKNLVSSRRARAGRNPAPDRARRARGGDCRGAAAARRGRGARSRAARRDARAAGRRDPRAVRGRRRRADGLAGAVRRACRRRSCGSSACTRCGSPRRFPRSSARPSASVRRSRCAPTPFPTRRSKGASPASARTST